MTQFHNNLFSFTIKGIVSFYRIKHHLRTADYPRHRETTSWCQQVSSHRLSAAGKTCRFHWSKASSPTAAPSLVSSLSQQMLFCALHRTYSSVWWDITPLRLLWGKYKGLSQEYDQWGHCAPKKEISFSSKAKQHSSSNFKNGVIDSCSSQYAMKKTLG